MHEKLQEVIDFTAEKFGLTNYYLKRNHIFREKSGLNETSYILNMEWFPNEIEQTDDYNPAGTASIDVDIHTKAVKRVIFVQGVNAAAANLPTATNTEETIEWIEQETGLEFGRQFKLAHDENNELHFHAAVDNVSVFPSGSIRVEFNEEGQLILFSIDGIFPDESEINWEPFALTAEMTNQVAKAHSKLLEVPLDEEEKWTALYSTTTVFVTNDGKRTLSFEEVENQGSHIIKDIILEWESPIDEVFSKKEIDLSLEVTVEQALTKEPSTDDLPLTDVEQEKVTEETRHFLQRVFPKDSGKWVLTGLWRESGYIFAQLKPTTPDYRVIDRKLKLVIDAENNQAINYIDNNVLLDMFKHFEKAEEPKLSQEEAFEKLREHIKVTPVYVYDKELGRYILCGKVDCEYAVDAVTGEVILLHEI